MTYRLLVALTGLVAAVSSMAKPLAQNFQINIHQSTFTSMISVTTLDETENAWFQGNLSAHGADLTYVFSRYATLGSGYYQVHNCIEASLDSGLTCQVNEAVHGAHISLLAGYNLNSDGLYAFTGARYFWEWNQKAVFGTAVVPIGIGFRLMDISIDLSTELRDSYTDYGAFEIFGLEPDSSYRLGSDYDSTDVSVLPIKLSLGYQF